MRPSRRGAAGSALLLAASLLLTACPPDWGDPPATTTTTSTTTSTTVPEPEDPTISGVACREGSGVTVVVDFTALDNSIRIGCADGPQANGIAALAAAGFAPTEATAGTPPSTSTVCTLDGLPTEGYPFCWLTGGFWGYWKADRPGDWDFSPVGAGQGPLVEGSVEGWAWAPGFDGDAPRLAVGDLDAYVPPLPVCDVPDAPVLTIISELETLPFTIDGGGPIEVATLAPDDDLDDAVWSETTSLALSGYSGATRVVARSASDDCDPQDIFDATYDVRPLYAPKAGTAGSPAVAATSPTFVGWATGYEDYVPGTDVTAGFQTPGNAVGPYSTSLVVLGNSGRITMTFADHSIKDGPGDDLAVFENGFTSSGNLLFTELAYVEVSSNGTDFVRFDSASRQPTPVGAFAYQPNDLLGGLAGKDESGWGTPFDLSALKNKRLVRDGSVDLDDIRYVRIVDVVGAADYPSVGDTYPDSFGRQIYDTHLTTGSGGFDLRAVGVFHQN